MFLDELPRELRGSIEAVCQKNAGSLKVFEELFDYLSGGGAGSGGDSKRRRTDGAGEVVKEEEEHEEEEEDDDEEEMEEINSIEPATIIFQVKDLSFQSPIRKKLNLTLSISPISQKPILSIGKRNEDKPELIIEQLEDVYFSTFLPVPEKPNQVYLIIFYKQDKDLVNEPIVLVMNKDQVTKQLVSEKLIKMEEDFKQYIQRQFKLTGFEIIDTFFNLSSSSSFKSFYVEAHRGSKEGYLFFLPNHLLFGFRKPLLLFNSADIESISYSSITRITFNINLVTNKGDKYEFSMIDQNEFGRIDEYIKNRSMMNNSLSEEFKAKKVGYKQDSRGQQLEDEFVVEEEEQQQQQQQQNEEEDDSDDSDLDANFQGNTEIDDTSDVSEDDDDDDEHGSETGSGSGSGSDDDE